MTEPTENFGNIPPIGSSQIGQASLKNPKNMPKPDVAMFDNAPIDVSVGSFFGRLFIGLAVGLCVVAILFGTLAAIGGLTNDGSGSASPILKVLLAVVGFIVQFVGSLALALMYNIFFSKRYYNFSKMFGLIFASSLIFFVLFILIYLSYEDIMSLYIILGFQVIFGLYISLNLIDFLSQPNYSASSMLGNTLGCILTVVVYLLITKTGSLQYHIVAIAAVVLAYTLMVLGSEIRNAIYYKFYEWGNNPFYLPSLNELREERQKEETKREKEEEEVNVDMK